MKIKKRISCPWCNTTLHMYENDNCPKCGGSLPDYRTGKLGNPPPVAPRKIPRQFNARETNRIILLSLAFALPMLAIPVLTFYFEKEIDWKIFLSPVGIFIAIYFFLVVGAIRNAYNLLKEKRSFRKLLRFGSVAEGEIKHIATYQDEIAYQFDFLLPGQISNKAVCVSLRKMIYYNEGDPVWVIYDKNNPEKNSVWPPIPM